MQYGGYILWDFDGTLAQRSGMWTGTLLEVLHAENLSPAVTKDHLRPFLATGFRWHRPEICHPPHCSADAWWAELEPVFARAFCDGAGLPTASGHRLAKQVRHVFLDPTRWSLFPDTLVALKSLTARGWRHVLLTNHVPELPRLLESLGLNGRFAALFNSAQTGFEKPHRSAFENVLFSLPPAAHVWMVGDNPVADVQGAEAVGIPAILVRKPHPSAKRYAADLLSLDALLEAGKDKRSDEP